MTIKWPKINDQKVIWLIDWPNQFQTTGVRSALETTAPTPTPIPPPPAPVPYWHGDNEMLLFDCLIVDGDIGEYDIEPNGPECCLALSLSVAIDDADIAFEHWSAADRYETYGDGVVGPYGHGFVGLTFCICIDAVTFDVLKHDIDCAVAASGLTLTEFSDGHGNDLAPNGLGTFDAQLL